MPDTPINTPDPDGNPHQEAVIAFSPSIKTSGYMGISDTAGQVASEALPALADSIGPAAQEFQRRLEKLDITPKEVQLELSVTLEGKYSWIIVAGGTASVKVTLKW